MYCTPLCSFTSSSSTSFLGGGGGPARSGKGATTDTLRSGWTCLFILALNIQRDSELRRGRADNGSALPAGGDSALSPAVSARRERGTAVIRAMQMRRERGDRGARARRGAPGERGCPRLLPRGEPAPGAAGESPHLGPPPGSDPRPAPPLVPRAAPRPAPLRARTAPGAPHCSEPRTAPGSPPSYSGRLRPAADYGALGAAASRRAKSASPVQADEIALIRQQVEPAWIAHFPSFSAGLPCLLMWL